MSAETTVEIVLFRVGATSYGADASQVLRVARPTERTHACAGLGSLEQGGRALVFRDPSGEEELELRIDEVKQILPVPVAQLRRVPPATGAPKGVIGFYLQKDRPVVLVDLPQSLDLPGGQ